MPPGVLFAVYDSEMGVPEYIPPEYIVSAEQTENT